MGLYEAIQENMHGVDAVTVASEHKIDEKKLKCLVESLKRAKKEPKEKNRIGQTIWGDGEKKFLLEYVASGMYSQISSFEHVGELLGRPAGGVRKKFWTIRSETTNQMVEITVPKSKKENKQIQRTGELLKASDIFAGVDSLKERIKGLIENDMQNKEQIRLMEKSIKEMRKTIERLQLENKKLNSKVQNEQDLVQIWNKLIQTTRSVQQLMELSSLAAEAKTKVRTIVDSRTLEVLKVSG